jgi:hypothetical protein
MSLHVKLCAWLRHHPLPLWLVEALVTTAIVVMLLDFGVLLYIADRLGVGF